MGCTVADEFLAESEWTQRAGAHRARVDEFTAPCRRRAQRGERHPVWDFLFSYYSLRPGRLKVWHPGYGTVLLGNLALEYLSRSGYVTRAHGVTIDPEVLRARMDTVRFVADLLRATQDRAPRFTCFGMHEWAMVYAAHNPRHSEVPLRLGSAGTDAVVESMILRCSHFDAYRFFTPAAAPRNETALTRAAQMDWEQPGCLHANMDIYKWCYKLGPLVDSELLMDCLQLAARARELDMKASPYDLTQFGFDPIAIEEPDGRAEYARQQRVISEQAAPLRAALLWRCERLLATDLEADMETKVMLPAGTMD